MVWIRCHWNSEYDQIYVQSTYYQQIVECDNNKKEIPNVLINWKTRKFIPGTIPDREGT